MEDRYVQGRVLQTGSLPGYVTLHFDFHTHTVFSDGEVWPVFRIREAMADGLDAMALTDSIVFEDTTFLSVIDKSVEA